MIGLSILLAVLIYVWLARFVARRIENRVAKYTVIAIFILIPTWDIILGKLYLNHLCSTESGVKVYRTVELPAGYWDKDGRPRFSVNGGADNRQTVFTMDGRTWEDKRFSYSAFTEPYNQALHAEKAGFRLSDRETGHIFGEVLYFRYWGGWIARNFSPHNSAVSCEIKNLDGWAYNIFKPATSTR